MSSPERALAPRHVWTSPPPRAKSLAGAVAGATVVAVLLRTGYLGWVLVACAALILGVYAPIALLYLLPWAVAFGTLATLHIARLNAGPPDVLVGALALGAALRARRRIPWRRVGTLPCATRARARTLVQRAPLLAASVGALAAYVLVTLASLLPATNRSDGATEVIKWAEVLVVVVMTRGQVRAPWQVRRVLWSAVGAGCAEALVGAVQWVLGSGAAGPGGASIRVLGSFGQPNPYAADLNLALPVALALALWATDARERWVMGAAAAIIFGAQLLAASRGALLALLVAIVLLLVVGLRRERAAALAAVVALPLVLGAWFAHLIPAAIENRILAEVRLNDVSLHGQVNDANFSTVERLAHWVAGLRMFAAHPLLGVGAGNYDAAYARYMVAGWPEPLGHAHNYYINAAAETGVLGLLAFLAVCSVALAAAWCATHPTTVLVVPAAGAPGWRDARPWAVGLGAVVVTVLVHSVVDDLFVHAMELQFALSLGCLLAIAARAHAVTATAP